MPAQRHHRGWRRRTALEASLAENIARLPMDEVDQYRRRAVRRHRTASQEAAGDRRAHPARRSMLLCGRHRVKTLRILTRDVENNRRRGTAGPLAKELSVELGIRVSSALFPSVRLEGRHPRRPFRRGCYFDNAGRLWKLQTNAIVEKQAAYLKAG